MPTSLAYREAGIYAVFGPGTPLADVIAAVREAATAHAPAELP